MSAGVFDQLSQLSQVPPAKTSSVGSPEASKTTENHQKDDLPATLTKQPVPRPTVAHTPANADPSDRSNANATQRPTVRTSDRTTPRSDVRPPGRPKHRTVIRYSFEFYQDQVALLRQISLQAKLAGDDLSMSEMVREALDEYITHKNFRPDERTG